MTGKRLYSTFFRGNNGRGKNKYATFSVEADNVAEAARIAEETRDEHDVDPGFRLIMVGEEV